MGTMFEGIAGLPERLRRKTGSSSYVPQIDGLRFLAILPVLIWHSSIRGHRFMAVQAGLPASGEPAWLPAGEIGVELFFFVSGYIIAYPFVTAHGRGRTVDLRAFYRRRLTRLEPPYVIVLTLCFVLFALAGRSLTHNAGRALGPAVPPFGSYLASLVYLHAPIWKTVSALNPPIWSLEIEVQFYLLAPFLVAAYLAVGKRALRGGVGLVAIALAIAGAAAIRVGYGEQDWRAYTLAAQAYPFLLGIVASDFFAAYRARGDCRETRGADLCFFAGIPILIASGFWQWGAPGAVQIARDGARAVALAALFWGAMQGRTASRLVGQPWVALIGGACYSIYLVHVPVMVAIAAPLFKLLHPTSYGAALALAFAVLIPAGVVAGMIYYAWIERPCMDPRWPGKLADRLAGRARLAAD